MSRRGTTSRETDWLTVFLYFGLVLVGFLMIYAVGYVDSPEMFDFSAKHGAHLMWIGISLIAGLAAVITDARFYKVFAYPIYGIGILLLVLVLFLGKDIAGARSWFELPFGIGRFQPSEFAKFATCIALAAYLSTLNITLTKGMKHRMYAIGIIILPVILIIIQGDAGSALVFTALFLVLFRAGMPAILYMLGSIVAILSVIALIFKPLTILAILLLFFSIVYIGNMKTRQLWWLLGFTMLATVTVLGFRYDMIEYALTLDGVAILLLKTLTWQERRGQLVTFVSVILVASIAYSLSVNYAFNNLLQSHQQDRINVWLQPSKSDPLGAAYNLDKSKTAISAGGLTGRGFRQGQITGLKYVPEQSSDFIFCTVGEEHGFFGTATLILLYISLILRITFIAERQREDFTRYYAYGIASILFFHFFVNIGMTMGVMPIIGIPLPFISYGGSSLLSFTILLAVLIKLDSTRLTRN